VHLRDCLLSLISAEDVLQRKKKNNCVCRAWSSTQWFICLTKLSSAQSCGFGGLGVSVLASGTQVRGYKPGRSRRIFKGEKILSTSSFGREVKPWVPCRRFAACKRSLSVPWKSALRQSSRSLFSTRKFQIPPLECGDASVGARASGGQSWKAQSGRYNKPVGCSADAQRNNQKKNAHSSQM
jgi:hypothetical protein